MIRLIAATAFVILILVAQARADVFQTYDLTFTNITPPAANPTAAVSGTVTLDTTALSNALTGNYNTELSLSPASNYVSAVTITVTGAASANGTFMLPVFASFIIDVPTAVDFNSQLIGQVTDFNFVTYGDDAVSPTEVAPLQMKLADGEIIDLESIDPVVAAEPLSVAIFSVGLIALGIGRRRRRV